VRRDGSILRCDGAAVKKAAALSFCWALAGVLQAATAQAGVIPQPNHVILTDGSFTVGASTLIHVPAGDPDAAAAARYLVALWTRTNHLTLSVVTDSAATVGIRFQREANTASEGYRVNVTPQTVTISAATATGLFYGAVTLWQLLPPAPAGGMIAAQRIDDAPRFQWRGLMLDSSRHFQSPAFIESMLDWMAWHKLNVFHWHLTDDQGWRLEIRKYPKLTSIGAWRDDSYYGPHYGGYYTQAQVREIVAFAAARHIQVVPEIDVPGHATAAIAAYPRLGSSRRALSVSSRWGVHDHLFNLDPATFRFLQDVLLEVIELFPSPYIHLGGDEAVKNEWDASPQVQARARALGIQNSAALQTYFTRRMDDYLRMHGRRMIGWDEILTPGLAGDAVVMSWHGVSGARAAARAGNDTILSPQPTLYFDRRQSTLASEPPGRLELATLEDVYRFDPQDPTLTAAQRRHVLGLQANIWTEHIRTGPRVEWMTLPRAAALAEAAWSEQHDWPDFLQRLVPMFQRYRAADLNYADSVFGIESRLSRSPAGISVTLSTGVGDVHYTLDGTFPTEASAHYGGPLTLPEGSELRAATFLQGALASRPVEFHLDAHSGVRRDSHELDQCTHAVGLLLEPKGGNTPLAVDIMNPCWIDRGVDLSEGPQLLAAVAALPFNYALGADTPTIQSADARTPQGELEVHIDSCDAPASVVLPLGSVAPAAPAVTPGGSVVLPASRLPRLSGRHDLCLRFARPTLDPLWALDWIEIQ
jgi:hexosaminidase